MGENIFIFIAIVVLIVFFFTGRELVCWYWKINDRLNVLKSIDDKLAFLMPKDYIPKDYSSLENKKEAELKAYFEKNKDNK